MVFLKRARRRVWSWEENVFSHPADSVVKTPLSRPRRRFPAHRDPPDPCQPPPHGTCPRHRLSNWTNSSMMTISMTLTLNLLVSGSWNSTLKLSLISPIFDELVVVRIVSWLLVAAGFYFTPLSKVLTLHFPVILFSGFRFLIFNISVVVIIIIVTLYL